MDAHEEPQGVVVGGDGGASPALSCKLFGFGQSQKGVQPELTGRSVRFRADRGEGGGNGQKQEKHKNIKRLDAHNYILFIAIRRLRIILSICEQHLAGSR